MTAGGIELITSKQQKVALRGIRVRSRLTAMGQRTTIEQTFLNLEDEAVTEGERIEEKVLRTFSRLSTPALTDLAVQWETGGELEQAPAEIPPLFDGDAMVIYARCAGKGVPGGVTLRCDTPAGPRAWTMNISPAHGGREMLPLLWARRMIQSLEEADSQAGKERLVTLSKESGLLCRYTKLYCG